MSRSRQDLHKARLRRERIRRAQQAERAAGQAERELPAAVREHPFAAERSLWEIEALLQGQSFESLDELNAQLSEMTRGGRLAERAAAWKQDDPQWRAQQIAYDALETDDFVEALRLVHEALEVDPDCTDAQRLMVSLLPAPLDNKIHLMQEVVDKAEQKFGEEFFAETMGHFWGKVTTRPYMRAKQHLGELLAEAGRREEAIAVFARMLELNPNDSQGIRRRLVALYLAMQRPELADEVMSRYPDDSDSAIFAWARVLERWQAGKKEQAEAALSKARELNRLVWKYATGARRPPAQAPLYFSPGDESEAQVCAVELGPAWEQNAEFREWLRERA